MRTQIALAAFLLTGSLVCAQEVRIGVLGLFHPRQLVVSAPVGTALVIHAGHQEFTLENSSNANANIQSSGESVLVRCGTRSVESPDLRITTRENGPGDFLLSAPGKVTRHYRGTLQIKAVSGILTPIVSMDIETAVASVVAAESLPGAPVEALKAQAVAARSYFAAGKGRHDDFDFCDTTHCQFLRAPPHLEDAASKATLATRGLVITFQSQAVAAMYTRSCDGRTHTPTDRGLPAAAYPYYSVECKYCREHPTNWQSRISRQDAAQLHSSDEASRLETGRRLGWNVIQSDDFTVQNQGHQVVVEGEGLGHGIGLCQFGASAMAQEGSDYRQILAHYYPNTKLANLAVQFPSKR